MTITITDIYKYMARTVGSDDLDLPPFFKSKNGEDPSIEATQALLGKSTDGSMSMRAGFLIGIDLCVKLFQEVTTKAGREGREPDVEDLLMIMGYIGSLFMCLVANETSGVRDRATPYTAHNLETMHHDINKGVKEMKADQPTGQEAEVWE
jgi:hypothetical protein